MTKLILILGIAAILIIGIVDADQIAFAHNDDDEPQTLEAKCAEELEDDDFDLEVLFCIAILALQEQITELQKSIADLQAQINSIELTPGPQGPPGPPGSGGTTDAPALSFTFSPQLTQPSGLDCNAGTAGTIYYQEIPGKSSQMCACIDITGAKEYGYQDLFGDSECSPP